VIGAVLAGASARQLLAQSDRAMVLVSAAAFDGGICTDYGCTGGDEKCVKLPSGALCYTGSGEQH